jgi:hypothetical protein
MAMRLIAAAVQAGGRPQAHGKDVPAHPTYLPQSRSSEESPLKYRHPSLRAVGIIAFIIVVYSFR